MASGPKELDVRWIRRYRGFCIAGSVICLIQVFLAYIFFTTYAEDGKSLEKYANNKNGHLELQLLDDRNDMESSRRFKEAYLTIDDEEDDSPGNSNAVESRLKLLPDELDQKAIGDVVPDKYRKDATSTDGSIRSLTNKTWTLRLEELDFVPLCDVTGKEAVSAIHRAKTQHCKQLLANVSCLNQQGDLYPQRLPHLCPSYGQLKILTFLYLSWLFKVKPENKNEVKPLLLTASPFGLSVIPLYTI